MRLGGATSFGATGTRFRLFYDEGREHVYRYLWPVVVALTVSLSVGVAPASADGGNAANAQLCQKGGWQTLVRSDGSSFASQGECVSYAARGGTLASKTKSQLDCESFGGTFTESPSAGVLWTCTGYAATFDEFSTRSEVLVDDCFFLDGGQSAGALFRGGDPIFFCESS